MCQLVVGEFLLWKFGTPGGHSIVIKLLCIIIIYFNLFPGAPTKSCLFLSGISQPTMSMWVMISFWLPPMSVSVVGLDCFHIFMGNCIQRLWKEMILSFGDQTGIHYKELTKQKIICKFTNWLTQNRDWFWLHIITLELFL